MPACEQRRKGGGESHFVVDATPLSKGRVVVVALFGWLVEMPRTSSDRQTLDGVGGGMGWYSEDWAMDSVKKKRFNGYSD